jgi:hypothetical protein
MPTYGASFNSQGYERKVKNEHKEEYREQARHCEGEALKIE